jgi:pimeloyl-ACP methyl ester carboxylesterase
VFEATLRSNPRQMRKGWYMFFYQLPRVPEWFQRRDDFAFMTDALREAREGAFTDEDLRRYRALFRHTETPSRERVAAPTLVIWGERDDYLLPEVALESLDYCENGRLEPLPHATHWRHHEYPDRVSDLLLEHLGS